MIKQNSKGNNRGITAVSILERSTKAYLCLLIKKTHRACFKTFWSHITRASGIKDTTQTLSNVKIVQTMCFRISNSPKTKRHLQEKIMKKEMESSSEEINFFNEAL